MGRVFQVEYASKAVENAGCVHAVYATLAALAPPLSSPRLASLYLADWLLGEYRSL